MQPIAASVRSGYALTPNDTSIQKMDAIWVGTGGTLVLNYGGADLTFTNVPSGAFFETHGCIVKATGTTATGLVAVFWNSKGNT